MERLMVALEEVPPDMFRTSLLKGLPLAKAGGRSSPSRRSGVLPGTPPDRKSRVGLAAQRAPSPLSGMASGGATTLSGAASGVLSEAAPADADGGGGAGGHPVPEPTAMPPSSPPPPPPSTNTINDTQFFPELPDMILGLAERLSKVIHLLCLILCF